MQKVKRIGEFIKKNLKWILLFLCTIIFLDLVEDVFEKEIMKLDIITYNFISTYLISDLLHHQQLYSEQKQSYHQFYIHHFPQMLDQL